MMNPIISDTVEVVLRSMIDSHKSEQICTEILRAHKIVETVRQWYLDSDVKEFFQNDIFEKIITNDVSAISVRLTDSESEEIMVSFLPKDKELIYTSDGKWSRANRQTGKPAKIFQKLLKTKFTQRDWENFANDFKSSVCGCAGFELLSGSSIRWAYCEENYYKCSGTLGNSCMRYRGCRDFFDIYVDNAKILVSKKNGLVTGRAIVWKIGDVTIMDRIYTCFDYLENCFIDYAKSNGWWIRSSNCLLHTGENQSWFTPDDDYEHVIYRQFTIELKRHYDSYPYMDSFRYFDKDSNTLTNFYVTRAHLDSTSGDVEGDVSWECADCGAIFYSAYDDETPEGLHWSDYEDDYYCDDCCWWCEELGDWISNRHPMEKVYVCRTRFVGYPSDWVDDHICYSDAIGGDDIIVIDGKNYLFSCIKDEVKYDDSEHAYYFIQ